MLIGDPIVVINPMDYVTNKNDDPMAKGFSIGHYRVIEAVAAENLVDEDGSIENPVKETLLINKPLLPQHLMVVIVN